MQKNLNLKTLDKKIIYWKLDTPKGKSKWLVIFIHGLTDNFDSHMLPNSAKYFTSKWYTTYRFNLYGDEKQARKLKEVRFKNHIQDVNTVIKYFQKAWAQKIFLVGHSLGWLTILYSNIKHVSWIILRDASIGGKDLLDEVDYNVKTGIYSIDRWDGFKHIIGASMYKDFLIKPQKHLEKISKIHIPIKIICAEKWVQKIWKIIYKTAYYEAANEPKKLIIIPGSGHCFDEKWVEQKLFTETYKRVKKYSN